MSPLSESRALVAAAWNGSATWEKNMPAALSILQQAVESNPNDPLLLTGLGVVLCDLGRYKEATKFLRKAIRLGSTDYHVHFALAVAVFNASGRAPGMRLFKRAEGLAPSPETWGAYFDPQAQ